jgi:hypothetical protein
MLLSHIHTKNLILYMMSIGMLCSPATLWPMVKIALPLQQAQTKIIPSIIHALNQKAQQHITPENFGTMLSLGMCATALTPVVAKLYRKAYPSLRAAYMRMRRNELENSIQKLQARNEMLDAALGATVSEDIYCLYDVAQIIEDYIETKDTIISNWLSFGVPPLSPSEHTQLETIAPFFPFMAAASWIPLLMFHQTLQTLDDESESENPPTHSHNPYDPDDNRNGKLPFLVKLHLATMLLMFANGFFN